MTEKNQNRLIFLSLALGIIALLWAALRKTSVGQYIESGDWLPPMGSINIPSISSGDIIIQPLQFADWGPRDSKTIDPAAAPGAKENCGCNAFICKPGDPGLAMFSPNMINLALYSAPFGNNLYLGY